MAIAEEFEWHVAKTGHRWAKAQLIMDGGVGAELEWVLSDWQPAGELEAYCPLRDYSGLFRTFADLANHFNDIGSLEKADRAREALKAFADRYGMLGVAKGISRWSTTEAKPDGRKQFLGVFGEGLNKDWIQNLFAVRHALDVWNLLQQSDVDGLSRVIVWGQDQVSYHSPRAADLGKSPSPPGQVRALIASKIESPEIYERFRRGYVIEPAWLYLGRAIDAHLREHTETHFRRNSTQEHPVIYPYPRNLLGAIWLQFGEAVSGNKKYRTCKECQRWFEVSFPTEKSKDPVRRSRADQLYCSTACRSKAYRGRQEQARRMHAEGKAPREIANALGSDLDAVKKWISGTSQ
jgi:hypothetical protein